MKEIVDRWPSSWRNAWFCQFCWACCVDVISKVSEHEKIICRIKPGNTQKNTSRDPIHIKSSLTYGSFIPNNHSGTNHCHCWTWEKGHMKPWDPAFLKTVQAHSPWNLFPGPLSRLRKKHQFMACAWRCHCNTVCSTYHAAMLILCSSSNWMTTKVVPSGYAGLLCVSGKG